MTFDITNDKHVGNMSLLESHWEQRQCLTWHLWSCRCQRVSLDKLMNCVRMTCEVHYLCDAACDNAAKIKLW